MKNIFFKSKCMLYQNLMKTVPWIQYYLYKIKSMTEKDVLEELDHLKKMELELDDTICSVMDYFEIFLKRMAMCRRAAEYLGCRFKLTANGSKLC